MLRPVFILLASLSVACGNPPGPEPWLIAPAAGTPGQGPGELSEAVSSIAVAGRYRLPEL